MVGLKNGHIRKNVTPRKVNPRAIAGRAEEEEEEEEKEEEEEEEEEKKKKKRRRRRRRRRLHRGRPNDPVVRRPLREREIWGCLPGPLSPGCDQTTGPLVTPLSHAWWYEASARTGWRGVSTPTLGQIARVIYNFYYYNY